MSMIVIVDTSIYLNVLDVPGRNQDHKKVLQAMEEYIKANDHLFLPFAAIVETGNHIAHLPDGDKRRRFAEWFCRQTRMALEGEAPWKALDIPDRAELLEWLSDFPNASMRGVSLGDYSIIKQFHKLCARHPATTIKIWSLDDDLRSYERRV